jgi:hypothetical protein
MVGMGDAVLLQEFGGRGFRRVFFVSHDGFHPRG